MVYTTHKIVILGKVYGIEFATSLSFFWSAMVINANWLMILRPLHEPTCIGVISQYFHIVITLIEFDQPW